MKKVRTEQSRHKSVATKVIILLASVFLSTLIAAVSNLLSKDYFLYSSIILLITLIITATYLTFLERIDAYFWKKSVRRKFRKPLLGILKEEKCRYMFTRFTPEDWRNRFCEKYKIKTISQCEIDNKFAVIINPYGESYPEEDLMEFKTLRRIEEYMANGGIFVHAGGLAFFYGWDGKRNFPTGKELQLYQGTFSSPNSMIMQPIYAQPSPYSLVETLLRQRFRVATTMSSQSLVQVFQEKEDRNYVGDIEDTGGIRVAMEFRAIREPTPKCIPLLRAKSVFGTVYPIAAIPYGRGYLIVCGMDLNTQLTVMGIDLDKSEFEKIAVMLENFMRAIREGYIS